MSCYGLWLKTPLNLICSKDKIGTVKALIDLLKDFTSTLVPYGHIWIDLANKPGIHYYCSLLPILLSLFYNRIVNKEVNISMRFISNLSVFNFFELSSCHTLPRVHETWVMSQALSQPVREVFQQPHNSASQALLWLCLSVAFISWMYFFLWYTCLGWLKSAYWHNMLPILLLSLVSCL